MTHYKMHLDEGHEAATASVAVEQGHQEGIAKFVKDAELFGFLQPQIIDGFLQMLYPFSDQWTGFTTSFPLRETTDLHENTIRNHLGEALMDHHSRFAGLSEDEHRALDDDGCLGPYRRVVPEEQVNSVASKLLSQVRSKENASPLYGRYTVRDWHLVQPSRRSLGTSVISCPA
jgi:hypothetical protein